MNLLFRSLCMLGLAAGLSLGACFEDSASNASGCNEGDDGCSCYPNDTCNGDLVCTQNFCVSEDCIDGREGCVCDGGLCLTGLDCLDGICRPSQGGTAGSTTSVTTTDSTTTTESTTSVATTSPGTDSVGDTGLVCGVPGPLDPCEACLVELCCDQYSACLNTEDCPCWKDCVVNGLDDVDCPAVSMCSDSQPGEVSELIVCAGAACPVECGIVGTTDGMTTTGPGSTTAAPN